MKKTTILAVIVSVLGMVLVLMMRQCIVTQVTSIECDLKKIEQVYWCEVCHKALEDDQVASGYVCEGCDSKSDKPGECPECEEERVKAKWCKGCEIVISEEKVAVCVKTGYLCEKCWHKSLKPGKCPACKKEMTKVTVKSRVIYRCEGCGHAQYKPGKCDQDEESKCFGQPLTKTCVYSGHFPHIAE